MFFRLHLNIFIFTSGLQDRQFLCIMEVGNNRGHSLDARCVGVEKVYFCMMLKGSINCMTPESKEKTQWRARGAYLPRLASKTGLLEETRQFLQTYARLRDTEATRQALVNGGLPQRSRATRTTIVEIVQVRLVRWHPPTWVLDDLVAFAQEGHQTALQAALLLHTARQDKLLYDIVQEIVVPRWQAGEREIIRANIQRFLDAAQPLHPEVDGWSYSTREKLSRNILTTLRDFGLLQGTVAKQIVEPMVPSAVVRHLIRLLREEGIAEEDLARHPDWQLWLWDTGRAQKAIEKTLPQEHTV
jgi:hypothetical protein